jgi:hypothetical protein
MRTIDPTWEPQAPLDTSAGVSRRNVNIGDLADL